MHAMDNRTNQYTLKSCFFLLLTMGLVWQAQAQKEPQYTQYMYNIGSFNPAYVGTVETPEVIGLYRAQWIDIEGAPRTVRVGANLPMKNERHGLGINIVNDQLGPSTQTFIDASYSFQIKLDEAVKLSFGIDAGGSMLNVDYSKGLFEVSGEVENVNKFYPTVGAGTFLYSDKWYVGISAPNFLTNGLYDEEVAKVIEEKIQLNFIAGYVFDLSENLEFKPAALLNTLSGAPLNLNLSANFRYARQFTLGVGYHVDNAISGLAGFQLAPSTFVGYAYDYNTNNLADYNNGSHEIILKFYLGKKGSSTKKKGGKDKNKIKQIDTPRFF